MNCLEMSRDYFFKVAEPKLRYDFPGLYPRLAAGLVGNGSECFGYDDEISRDHDWGIDFFIWVTDDDGGAVAALQDWKDKLFSENPPEFARERSEYGARVGIMTCSGFYRSLIGAPQGPRTVNEWIRAPEENFAMAVNGEVFIDGPGDFTKTREYLLNYYPEDIRLKKIAAKCMALAQTGQYNHERIAKRRDWVTLRSVLSRFNDIAISMAFALNRVYKPYYKWAYRALKDLPPPGAGTARILLLMAETAGLDDESHSKRQEYIAELCELFIQELKTQGLSGSDDWFMTAHGEEAMQRIEDSALRSLPAQYEI